MQLKRKPILITGVTRFNLVQVEELIKKYQLFGCSMLVTPEDFTDEYVRMLNRYNVTVMLPFMSTTDHPDSIEEEREAQPRSGSTYPCIPTNQARIPAPSAGWEHRSGAAVVGAGIPESSGSLCG